MNEFIENVVVCIVTVLLAVPAVILIKGYIVRLFRRKMGKEEE